MPLYEYECRKCGTGYERRLKFEERLEKQQCPACGESASVLKLSAPAVLASNGTKGGGAAEPTGGGFCPSTGQSCGCGAAQWN